jgi:hypothetical protein
MLLFSAGYGYYPPTPNFKDQCSMPRKLIRRYLPDNDTLRHHKYLRHFGRLLLIPNLWHLNRRSVSGAIAAGLFIAFIPVPFQMVLAAAAAILLRVNLPIAVAMVWVSNPLTMGPFFYLAYKIGAWILQLPAQEMTAEISVEWLMQELSIVWQPFLLGCIVIGAVLALLGFVVMRLLWRLYVINYLRKRRQRANQKNIG